jgi:hypothetical protein
MIDHEGVLEMKNGGRVGRCREMPTTSSHLSTAVKVENRKPNKIWVLKRAETSPVFAPTRPRVHGRRSSSSVDSGSVGFGKRANKLLTEPYGGKTNLAALNIQT